jgi:hypothetical protein
MTEALTPNNQIMNALFFPGEFSPQECDRILAMPADLDLTQHYLQSAQKDMPVYSQQGHFSSELLPYKPEHEWLFNRLGSILHSVNKDYYHFEIDNLVATQRVTFETGDQLDWHLDLGEGAFSLRKICLTLFLTDTSNYSGGIIEIGSTAQRHHRQPQGSLLIYPAYFMSRVHAITAGRFVYLQTWVQGLQPFA